MILALLVCSGVGCFFSPLWELSRSLPLKDSSHHRLELFRTAFTVPDSLVACLRV